MIDVLLNGYLLAIIISGLALAAFLFKRGPYKNHGEAGRGSTQRLSVQDIPGPLSLPWLGTGWITTAIGPYSLSHLHEAYHDLKRRYGSIVRLEAFGNIPVINVFERGAIERVGGFPSRSPIRPPTEISVVHRKSRPDRYTNAGMVNEQGGTWNFLRKTLTKDLVNKKVISRHLLELDQIAESFATLLRSHRDSQNQVPDIELIVKNLGLESTCAVILGRRIGVLDDEVNELAKRLGKAVDDFFCACRDSYYGIIPLWKYIPSKLYAQYEKADDELHEIISRYVDDALMDKEATCESEAGQEVYESILHAHGIDKRDKKSAIIDFITSGVLTVGSTALFLLCNVAKRPDIQERIYEEITSLSDSGELLTLHDLRKAKYLNAVVNESYRISPAAIAIARILEEGMELSGYHLPAGSVVLLHNWVASLDEKNFSYAKEFRPERWIPEESQGWRCSPKLLAPFGYGTRKCPGEIFIDQVLHLLLARMVREFRMDYEGDLETNFEFLLVPKGPVKLILNDRS